MSKLVFSLRMVPAAVSRQHYRLYNQVQVGEAARIWLSEIRSVVDHFYHASLLTNQLTAPTQSLEAITLRQTLKWLTIICS
ncbi:hypothetical protein ABH905_003845 [Pseudomonas frederiksbergensis]|jgi:hypothetical protein